MDVLANLNLGLSDEELDEDDNVEIVREGISHFATMLPAPPASESIPSTNRKRGRKRKNKKKITANVDSAKVPNKRGKSQWADNCMYAELLEMKQDAIWDSEHVDDGLPDDLESGWIAVSGIPMGKRCLAVTYHSSGIAGSGRNKC